LILYSHLQYQQVGFLSFETFGLLITVKILILVMESRT